MPSIETVSPAAIAVLARALGLTPQQEEVMRGLVMSTEQVDSPRVAQLFGLRDQTIRLWRRDRRTALAEGRTLGAGEFIAEVGHAGQSPTYLLGAVYLWGMQTERLLWDGSINPNRLLPGRHVGAAPRPRVPQDREPQRKAVLAAYRTRRREGYSDQAAREHVAADMGLTRQVVARRLLEVTRDPKTYGPLWAEPDLAKAS